MKRTGEIYLMIFFLVCGLCAGCGKEKKWKYDRSIPESIQVDSTQGISILGNLDQIGVRVELGENFFEQEKSISLFTPQSIPAFPRGLKMEPLNSPVEITLEGEKGIRLDHAATITYRLDSLDIPSAEEAWQLMFMYYNGREWEMVQPDSIDLSEGIVSLNTYHFSLFGLTKIKDETVLFEKWTKSSALDSLIRDTVNEKVDKACENAVTNFLEDMEIQDDSLKAKLLKNIVNSDDYRELIDNLKEGKVYDFCTNLQILMGEKIADNMEDSVLKGALEKAAKKDNLDYVKAFSTAAGYLAEGRKMDAAKVLGDKVVDSFKVGRALKTSVEIINGQIQEWKSNELKAAYEAYANGADGKWGYYVDKRDFETLWSQMRGLGRQLEIDAVAQEEAIRQEYGEPPLTETQKQKILANLKDYYRRQFETMAKTNDELETRMKERELLLEELKKSGFFGAGTVDALNNLPLDKRLEIIDTFLRKMTADTGRSRISNKTGLVGANELFASDIAQALRIYFGKDGKSEYRKFLKERYGIEKEKGFIPSDETDGIWVLERTFVNMPVLPEGYISSSLLEYTRDIYPGGAKTHILNDISQFPGWTGDVKTQTIEFSYVFSIPESFAAGETVPVRMEVKDSGSSYGPNFIQGAMGCSMSVNTNGSWVPYNSGEWVSTQGYRTSDKPDASMMQAEKQFSFTAPGKADAFTCHFTYNDGGFPPEIYYDYIFIEGGLY